MAIERIDTDLCTGCRKCMSCCPADVIRMDNDNQKAFIKYQEDCSTCFFCMLECSENAITMSVAKTSPYFTSWG